MYAQILLTCPHPPNQYPRSSKDAGHRAPPSGDHLASPGARPERREGSLEHLRAQQPEGDLCAGRFGTGPSLLSHAALCPAQWAVSWCGRPWGYGPLQFFCLTTALGNHSVGDSLLLLQGALLAGSSGSLVNFHCPGEWPLLSEFSLTETSGQVRAPTLRRVPPGKLPVRSRLWAWRWPWLSHFPGRRCCGRCWVHSQGPALVLSFRKLHRRPFQRGVGVWQL